MAERFYSIQPDENGFANFNNTHQQQHIQLFNQLPQYAPQPQPLMSLGQPNLANPTLGGGDFEYSNNPVFGSYFNPSAALELSASYNRRFFPNQQLTYTNKVLPSNLIPKYTTAGGGDNYIYPNASNPLMGMGPPPGTTMTATNAEAAANFNQMPNNSLTTSSAAYNRCRYMPYMSSRAATAAAANPSNTAQSTSLLGSNPAPLYHFQPVGNFYQGYPIVNGGVSSTVTAATAAAISAAKNATAAGNYERAPHNISGDFTYGATLDDGLSANGNGHKINGLDAGAVPHGGSLITSTPYHSNQSNTTVFDPSQTVTLQITNLDYSMDEPSLRKFLLNQLKPITPVVSLAFEGTSYAKVTVPDLYFAKQVVSNLHRKKVGHKRILVSYTRDSSLTEFNTLRCQVAGLLKDVPFYTLPMYKFRELFQSRFKTSISVLDLYKMQDICTISTDNNEEKFISLQPDLINSLESSPLMEGLQHSVPYCTLHFKREQHKGWAEQELEPLPNVCMSIADVQKIIHALLKCHPGDVPVASLVQCVEAELSIQISANDNGVNLEHLICCVQGIQIQVNNFGIKILSWLEVDKDMGCSSSVAGSASERGGLFARSSLSDPLFQISREVVELVKMSPKSTMKFNRFIPAYHNHFGKQCRVADYGYTKLIELFEALATVVQIMGDGENRQITLTHRTQTRRFTSDLLRVIRTNGNKSVLLSQLPTIFTQTQNRPFDITDYGVCDVADILDGLVNSNTVTINHIQNGKDIVIAIPKRKQTTVELENTCVFAGEMVELFRNAPQYTILFQKFVRSYHYHFAYQCRLSDYGYLKLADLMEAIHGVVEIETNGDEDKKIALSPIVARRVFAEQCEELIRNVTGSARTCMKLNEVLKMHKKQYGYQIQARTLGVKYVVDAVKLMPYVEIFQKDDSDWMICHSENATFRTQCYRICKLLKTLTEQPVNSNEGDKKPSDKLNTSSKKTSVTLKQLLSDFNAKYEEKLEENTIRAMRHALKLTPDENNNAQYVSITKLMNFLLKIVSLLEQRQSMLLYELKIALECDISTTFKFGYPNLFSLLTAYSDLFSMETGSSHERSEVSLVPTCELRQSAANSHQHLFGSLKLPSSKQKVMRSTRLPLSELNATRPSFTQGNTGLTYRSRMTALDFNQNMVNQVQNSRPSYMHTPYYCPPSNRFAANNNTQHQQQPTATIISNNSKLFAPPNVSITSSNSLNSSLSNLSTSNKENSFNNSLNLYNNSLNSSNNSLSDLNTSSLGNGHMNQMSLLPPPPAPPGVLFPQQQAHSLTTYSSHALAAKYWERDLALQQLQQPQAVVQRGTSLFSPPKAPPTTQSLDLLPSSKTDGDLYELMTNMYKKPKPDSPTQDNMPFWIDPIWSNKPKKQKTSVDVLNIKLPELEPKMTDSLSPYTISKVYNMNQDIFNFDNTDRKLA